MTIDRHRGLPKSCWFCWWREGHRCFQEKLGTIPTEPMSFTDSSGQEHSYTRRLGLEITDGHYTQCVESGGYKSKRATWMSILPPDIDLVIMSEKTFEASGGRFD